MSTTQPIREYADIKKLKNYFLERGEYRDYMLVSVCLNTALRICDIVSLKWTDIFNNDGTFKKHIKLYEKKTDKLTEILINKQVKKSIMLYIKNIGKDGEYLFASKKGGHIGRHRAFEIITSGGKNAGLGYTISCHFLRKTFGYHAWKKGTPPAILMQIYNHSSFEITKRYLGINQDDKDKVYRGLEL